MKTISRILLVCVFIVLVLYITENRVKENKPLEAPVTHGTAVPTENLGIGSPISKTSRPETGISTYVGDTTEVFIEKFGKPDRIEPSAYAYDWWIYNESYFIMIGVSEKGKINQIYTLDSRLNVHPFELNQPLDDIYRFSIIEAEIDAEVEENNYTFLLNNDDLQSRPLIKYKDLFAQLYVDETEARLSGVRFIDPATIVVHQPYEMMYMGDLLTSHPLSSVRQLEVNESLKRQVFELTNVIREKNDQAKLQQNYHLTQFAQENSKQLAFENLISDEERENETLSKRLKEASIDHRKAEENTALNYQDAIEAVHGWLNSKAHRKTMLTKDFTHLGVGVYGQYYTQTFIKSTDIDYRKN